MCFTLSAAEKAVETIVGHFPFGQEGDKYLRVREKVAQ